MVDFFLLPGPVLSIRTRWRKTALVIIRARPVIKPVVRTLRKRRVAICTDRIILILRISRVPVLLQVLQALAIVRRRHRLDIIRRLVVLHFMALRRLIRQ